MYRQRVKYSLIILSMFMASQAFAAAANNIIDVNLNQTSDDSVKINIYTDKPYKDQIIVNKKQGNQYVILLPETSTSIFKNPDVRHVPALNSVEVKEQQYSSLPDKGYTKIIIESKKPVEIIPQAFLYKKTTAENSKEPKATNKSYVTTQQVPMALPQRVLNPHNEEQNFAVNTPKAQQDYVAPSTQKTIQQKSEPENTQPNKNESVKEVKAVNEDSVSTDIKESVLEDSTQQEEQVTPDEDNKTEEIQETPTKQNEDISEEELAFFKKLIRFKQKVAKKIKKILSVKISFNSFATVLQLILLGVLIKLITDFIKKLNKDEQPLKTRLIHGNDERLDYPSYSNMDVYSSTKDNFTEDSNEGFNLNPNSTSYIEHSNLFNNYQNPYSTKNNKKLNLIDEVYSMSVFDENSKDIEKGIFKNPLTPISKNDEEKLFDGEDIEPSEENTPFLNNNDKETEEFLNYSNDIQDEDSFTIVEDEPSLYQNNYDNIEEVAEDDVYDLDAEYEDSDDLILEETEESSEPEYVYVDENGQEYDEINENEYEIISEENETQESSNEESKGTENPEIPEEPQDNPLNHLKVQSRFVIDSFRGFAHVNVDGINAIISYVGSNVGVIRKFKEDVNSQMQVRMNEQPDEETMIYIVKLGKYKTLVEVKPNSIRPLLDL